MREETAHIQKAVLCPFCTSWIMFNWHTDKLPKRTTVITEQTHDHSTPLESVVYVFQLMNDLSVRQSIARTPSSDTKEVFEQD